MSRFLGKLMRGLGEGVEEAADLTLKERAELARQANIARLNEEASVRAEGRQESATIRSEGRQRADTILSEKRQEKATVRAEGRKLQAEKELATHNAGLLSDKKTTAKPEYKTDPVSGRLVAVTGAEAAPVVLREGATELVEGKYPQSVEKSRYLMGEPEKGAEEPAEIQKLKFLGEMLFPNETSEESRQQKLDELRRSDRLQEFFTKAIVDMDPLQAKLWRKNWAKELGLPEDTSLVEISRVLFSGTTRGKLPGESAITPSYSTNPFAAPGMSRR